MDGQGSGPSGVAPDVRVRNQLTAEIVSPAFLAMGLLYLSIGLALPWLGRPPEVLTEHRILHLSAASILLGAWRFLARRGVREHQAHAWLFSMVVLVSFINARELVTLGDPSHGFYLTMTAFAAGYGFLSSRWFAAALATLLLAWVVPMAIVSPLPVEWNQWTARFSTGFLVSIAVFITRRRSVLRQDALRRRAEERETAAAQALAGATVANEKRLTMQRAMQAAQRRESLGLLAGGIAHDFNNLLTAINGNLELARDELAPDSPVQESLSDASAATEHATRLTRQMLAYAGRAKPRVTRVDLGARVHDVVRMLRSSLPAGVRLREDGKGPGPVVKADEAQLDQVLINLFQNAVDASRDCGGVIEVRWGTETLDDGAIASMRFGATCPAGRYAFFSVQDPGAGMEKDVRDRMFDPFFTTKSGGSGLGLAAVGGIAERHDALLAVSSAPGEGTCVRFMLPCVEGLATELHEPRSRSTLQRGTVLLVDDEASVRRVARRFLERAQFRVLEASSGAEALALAERAPELDAALIDLTMPGQNGYDLARALAERVPALPIVIMSGFDREDVLARRSAPPEIPFLSKPFSAEELVTALGRASSLAPRGD